MRLATLKNGGLSTYFDKFDGSEAGVNSSSLKQTFFNSFTETNGVIIRGHLPPDDLQNMFLYFVDRLKN